MLFDRDEEVMNKLVVIATAPTMDNPCGIPSNAMTEDEYLGFKGCSSPAVNAMGDTCLSVLIFRSTKKDITDHSCNALVIFS